MNISEPPLKKPILVRHQTKWRSNFTVEIVVMSHGQFLFSFKGPNLCSYDCEWSS